MKLILLFVLGCLIGCWVAIRFLESTSTDRPITVGDLRIIREEDDPYIFLQLDRDLSVLYKQKEVVLNVVITDVSQK